MSSATDHDQQQKKEKEEQVGIPDGRYAVVVETIRDELIVLVCEDPEQKDVGILFSTSKEFDSQDLNAGDCLNIKVEDGSIVKYLRESPEDSPS